MPRLGAWQCQDAVEVLWQRDDVLGEAYERLAFACVEGTGFTQGGKHRGIGGCE